MPPGFRQHPLVPAPIVCWRAREGRGPMGRVLETATTLCPCARPMSVLAASPYERDKEWGTVRLTG
jgi:hypothetical protein